MNWDETDAHTGAQIKPPRRWHRTEREYKETNDASSRAELNPNQTDSLGGDGGLYIYMRRTTISRCQNTLVLSLMIG